MPCEWDFFNIPSNEWSTYESILIGLKLPQEELLQFYQSKDKTDRLSNAGVNTATTFLHPAAIVSPEGNRTLTLTICLKCKWQLTNHQRRPLTHFFTGVDPVDVWLHDHNERPLSLPEKILTNCITCKTTIVKLVCYGDPTHAQRGVKGTCISFPQPVPEVHTLLPLRASDLSSHLKVVFVGEEPPVERTMRQLFYVRRHVVMEVISIRKQTGHPAYSDIQQRLLPLEDLPVDGVPACFQDTVTYTVVDEEQQGQSYVPCEPGANVETDEPIPIAVSAVLDVDGANLTSESLLHDILITRCTEKKNSKTVVTDKVDISKTPISAAMKLQKRIMRSNVAVVPSGGKPVNSWHNWRLWTDAFPHLFPHALGAGEDPDLNDGDRKLSLSLWARNLLRRSDRQFAQDPAFMFVVWQVLQVRAVCRSTKAMTSKPAFQDFASTVHHITTDKIKGSLAKCNKKTKTLRVKRSDPNSALLNKFLHQLRIVGGAVAGSEWEKSKWRHRMHAIMVMKGLPLFFITVNPADLHSPVFLLFAGELGEVTTVPLPPLPRRCAAVAKDPVSCARFFHFVITRFLADLLQGGVLGPLDEYFGTVETQGRGSLHLHLLVWILGSPPPAELLKKIFVDDDSGGLTNFGEKFRTFMDGCVSQYMPDVDISQHSDAGDSHIASTLPSKTANPDVDLKRILRKVQCHGHPGQRHNSCCFKYGSQTCRFNFPHPMADRTELKQQDGCLIIHWRRNDPWLNGHNEAMTRALRCNTDVRIVLGGAESLSASFYISDYITKKELTTWNALTIIAASVERFEKNQQGIAKDKIEATRAAYFPNLTTAQNNSRLMIVKCVNQILTDKERAGPDVATHLLGYPMHYTKAKFTLLYLGNIIRTVKEATGIGQNTPDDELEDESNSDNDSEDDYGSVLPQGNDDVPVQEEKDSGVLGFAGGVYFVHTPHDDYLYRPAYIRILSYFDMTTWFHTRTIQKTKKPKCDSTLFGEEHANRNSHALYRSKIGAYPQFVGGNFPSYKSNRSLFYFYSSVVFLQFILPDLQKWPRNLEEYEQFFNAELDSRHPLPGLTSVRIRRLINNIISTQQGKAEQNLRRKEAAAMREEAPQQQQGAYGEMHMESKHEYNCLRHSRLEDIMPAVGSSNTLATKPENANMTKYKDNTALLVIRATPLQNPPFSWDVTPPTPTISCSQFKTELKRQAQERLRELHEPTLSTATVGVGPPAYPARYFADKHGLEGKQRGAFFIMAKAFVAEQLALSLPHADAPAEDIPIKQVLSFVGGAGGCGKSHIINAFDDMVKYNNQQYRLRKAAYTGSAGANIGGTTIDWLIAKQFNTDTKANTDNGNIKKSRLQILMQRIGKCRYLILDETSMISSKYLAKINQRFQNALGSKLPFGGVHVFFFGDFFQYAPVKFLGKPLYDTISSWYQSTSNLDHVAGTSAWSNLTHVSMLTHNHRVKDPIYLKILNTMRAPGEPKEVAQEMSTVSVDDSYALLQTRIIKPNEDLPSPLSAVTPFLTPRNTVRHTLTAQHIALMSKRACIPPLVIPARDAYKKDQGLMDSKTRAFLQCLTDSDGGGLMGQLVLFPDMWLYLTSNVGVPLGLYNGTLGQLYGIVYHDEEPPVPTSGTKAHFLTYLPKCILFKVNKKPNERYHFSPQGGLPEGVIMVEPINMGCVYPKQKPHKYNWNRLQFPLGPAVAFTGYKVQGRTLPSGVMDLCPPPGQGSIAQDTYVFLSRFRTMADISLVRNFDKKCLEPEYTRSFKQHQKWLYEKATSTDAKLAAGDYLAFADLPIPRF